MENCNKGVWKSSRSTRRRSSFVSSRQIRSDLMKERVKDRLRAILRKTHSSEKKMDDCQGEISEQDDPLRNESEDAIDYISSNEDEEDTGEPGCDDISNVSTESSKLDGSTGQFCNIENESISCQDERILYEIGLKQIRRISYPFCPIIEEEITRAYSSCMFWQRWTTANAEVKCFTTRKSWDIDGFYDDAPIMVSHVNDGFKINLFIKTGENIVAFGVQKNESAETFYISAYDGNGRGPLVLRIGSDPTGVSDKDIKSDYRFFKRIYDERLNGYVLRPVFNLNLHLTITNGMLFLEKSQSNRDTRQWEINIVD